MAITGIQRNQPQGMNEACDELINMRFQNGAWRPIGAKAELYPKPPYKPVVIHAKDNIRNWIGYNGILDETITTDAAYARAVELGYTGDMNSYINALSEWDGTTGENAYSDYLYQVSATGYTGTYYEWLQVATPNSIIHYNPVNLSITQTVVTFNGTETLNAIRFVANFLIIVTTENLYRFLWKNDTYTRIQLTGIENNFQTQVVKTDEQLNLKFDVGALSFRTGIDSAATTELLGKYYKLVNEQSALSRFNGGMFYRIAIRLFDGSEILQSMPSYWQFGSYQANLHFSVDVYADPPTPYYVYLQFESFASIKITQSFVESFSGQFDLYKDLIQSIVIYASRVQSFYDFSERAITNESIIAGIETAPPGPEGSGVPVSGFLPISPDLKDNIYDSTNWWKIGEISFNKLVQQASPHEDTYSGEVTLDLKGFYDNFATREQIDQDNFSHHDLTGNASDIYNDRLELGDTRQSLALPAQLAKSILPSTGVVTAIYAGSSLLYEFDGTYDGLAQVKLDTTNGIKYVEMAVTLYVYASTGTLKAVFYPGLIGYPDYRAIELVINIKWTDNVYYEIFRTKLEKSLFGNFAFAVNKNFNVTTINGINQVSDINFTSTYMPFDSSDLTANTIHTIVAGDSVVMDGNRVQISEVNNPFVFPAKSSQQVSVGIIKAFGTSTEETSQGQFGQFPIYVLTSVGVWGLEIGTGDVYITNVVPINGEVIRDNAAKLDLSFGIAYISAEGLRIISGKNVIEISEPVEGLQDETLSDNANLQFFINHANIVQMTDYVDKVTFLTYLAGAVLGYNKGSDNNELIVMNPDYDYSYVYDIKHKYWFKMSGKHSAFISDYPQLYGVCEDGSGSVVNFSNEGAGTTQCLIITRAHSFDSPDVAKKLMRTFFRCFLNVTPDHFAAAYIFRSDNLKDWTFETGNDRTSGKAKDIWITHTFRSAKYYAFVFAANLTVDRTIIENRLSNIVSEYEVKMENKLR